MTTARDIAARRWMDEGTERFLDALTRTTDEELTAPTALPGWTGMHLVAHVAANADALLNLSQWARTGEETPMYSSPQQRDADIQDGARRSPAELRGWTRDSADRLATSLSSLTGEQWSRTVRTAQGRWIPATEIAWLRTREVMVHTIDLDPTTSFRHLPEDFVLALIDDAVARRSRADQPSLLLSTTGGRHTWSVSGGGEPRAVSGSLGSVAAYLTGRSGADVTSPSGDVPTLPPWL